MSLTTRESHACFGGTLSLHAHASTSTGTEMRFGVYVPPAAAAGPVPTVYALAGLTCTEETFLIKAGAARVAAELGLMLVTCDTSPRGVELPGDRDHWDFGVGAGFYLDATQSPWSAHYRMGAYVQHELPALIEAHFPALPGVRGITGHSMGGHGALVTALRAPERWRSVSAFAPIVSPSDVPWGIKAFTNYLGEDRTTWSAWDACALVRARPRTDEILVDVGAADPFLARELQPERFEAACKDAGQPLRLTVHDRYDHSYWFVQSFVEAHLRHHAARLRG